jgi:5-methylcytosine-specific restriction endonuclease McrA
MLPKPQKRSPKPRKPVKRSVRPHAVRQTKRAAQRRRLDRLWRKAVMGEGKPLCWNCGDPATDAAHLVSRRYNVTRWDRRNGLPLCRPCHNHFTRKPKEWDIVLWIHMPQIYGDLRRQAFGFGPVDLDQAARELAG